MNRTLIIAFLTYYYTIVLKYNFVYLILIKKKINLFNFLLDYDRKVKSKSNQIENNARQLLCYGLNLEKLKLYKKKRYKIIFVL